MELDHGRSPYHLVTRMDSLKFQLKEVKVNSELLKAKIDLINSRIHFMSEKISQIKEQGKSYFTTANLSESVTASKTLESFGGQKKPTCTTKGIAWTKIWKVPFGGSKKWRMITLDLWNAKQSWLQAGTEKMSLIK